MCTGISLMELRVDIAESTEERIVFGDDITGDETYVTDRLGSSWDLLK
jgi:hypothetical protein